MDNTEWIPVRRSNIKYYKNIELYYKNPKGLVQLYKPAGMDFSDVSLQKKPYLGKLYVKPEDKLKCLQEAQRGFSRGLAKSILTSETDTVKQELVNIMDETLSEPRGGSLRIVPDIINAMVEGYSNDPAIIKQLAWISHTDYTTAIHSINVMALTVGYCFYTLRSMEETRQYGLAALLHDVGKTEIPREILTAPRRLTPEEFETMKQHTTIGYDILQNYSGSIVEAATGCLEHHEKLDGSGYPEGKTEITECGRILAIIDCYEAITNDDRPYRAAMDPLKALEILKNEMDEKKYDQKIFEDFAYSLTDFSSKKHISIK
jgi:HD-GYP domain-containing protein (c-di-GMP phosphodiesterase class II)